MSIVFSENISIKTDILYLYVLEDKNRLTFQFFIFIFKILQGPDS